MKTITLLCCIVSFSALSQTRLISHKSHSGSTATFNTALKNSLFDIEASNFGEGPQATVRNAKLDSVIFISPAKAIMVTSEFCRERDYRKSDEENDSAPKTLWKAGRDTVYNHQLFSHNHSLDSIKNVLKNTFHFNNDTDNAVFVGYDNEKPKTDKQQPKRNAVPFVPSGDDNFPAKPLMIFTLALLSGALVFISYYIYKVKNTQSAL